MAGSNGTPDFVESNREDEILNLKYRGIVFHNPMPNYVNGTSSTLTGQQMLNDIWFDSTSPNAINGPSASSMSLALSQSYLTNVPSTWQIIIENSDTVNAKTITFPAGYTNLNGTSPATIIIPAGSSAIVGMQVSNKSPFTAQVAYVLPGGGGGGGGGSTFPGPGILVSPAAGSPSTSLIPRTIVSTDPDLVVSNGDGVAGNPSLTTAITGVGLIPGGQIQTTVNYFGEIFNVLNGFSQYGTGNVVVPAGSPGTPLAPTDDGTAILHPFGYGTANPGYTAGTAIFIPPVTTPVQAKVLYKILATCTFDWVDTASGVLVFQVMDLDSVGPVNVDDSKVNGNSNALPGYVGGSTNFGGEYMLTPGHRYQLSMINTDGVQAATVTFWHWSMSRVR